MPLDLATLQDEWESGTTETTETTVTGLWAILGDLRAFSEKACDVSVVLVVSVVSIWRWIRSVVCQLSEPRAAVIGAGYEVLCAESGRWGLLPQKADYLVLRFLAEDVVEKADAVLGTILGVIETGRVE